MQNPLLAGGAAPPHPRRPARQVALLATALVLAGVALGVALAGAAGLLFVPSTPTPSISTTSPPPPIDCFFALGGGTVRSGGLLPQPRSQAPPCWDGIRAYLRPGGGYDADVGEATASAAAFLASIPRPSGAALLVLDIDETALSNRAEWLKDDAGRELLGDKDAAALAASAPALAPTLRLYKAALAAGFSVAFVTGRSGRPAVLNATVANLEDAGYGRACEGEGGGWQAGGRPVFVPRAGTAAAAAEEPPCYSALLMRPPGDGRPASAVKPELRAALLAAAKEVAPNAALVASVGDQFSDLGGDPSPHAAFKLPNPVYFFV